MATRRPVKVEKTTEKEDIATIIPGTNPRNDTKSLAVPGSVIAKLLLFTMAMVVAPLGSYFLTVNTVFSGNTTYAGATAAVMANVVLITYVLVAMAEDTRDQEEAKKSQ
ncbi:hypothetical protein L873DRAFT_1811844 [Choiromyces venosus 120613-1]|uniref:Uncharacterized protein n=1 Tax=Choiromyces venosus 120613-1 TaxID=1336337 RepID=A0A3N4JQW5_9PEZI|nr:hypothetical protein L873DRAFT_1811844 [Choiromyces venosus 120613-1]